MIYYKVLLIIIMIATGSILTAQLDNDSTGYKLNHYFSELTRLKEFNGNVLVAKSGKYLLNTTYNMKGENDSLFVKPTSKFIIASVSKLFIKYAILKLVQSGKIALTDNLQKFIPDFPYGDKITVYHLLHHQSGLPRELCQYDKYDSLSLPKIIELAKLEKLMYEPGTQMVYSNIGYFLLHYIIDRASPKGYKAFMESDILAKMKLNSTGEFNYTESISDFAHGFKKQNGKIVSIPTIGINRFETGNYFSTMSDLFSFSKQIIAGNELDKTLVSQMYGKDSLLIQAGGREGYKAYLYVDPKIDFTFIFLSNYSDMPFQKITEDVMKIMEGKTYHLYENILRKKNVLPMAVIGRYVGKYELEIDRTQFIVVKLENGKLFFSERSGETTEMFAENEFTFFDNPESKDSYMFCFNPETNMYDLYIITDGIKLKTIRIE